MYRQGDLLIVRDIPPVWERRPVPDGVLLHGETTGHAHRVEGGEVYDVGPSRWIVANENTRVVHEEHDTIVLPEGTYRIIRQREFDEGHIRHVSD